MNLAERLVLAFGSALDPQRWVNAREVVPLLGSNATAWDEVQDALERLERNGYLTRVQQGATWFYQRKPRGEAEAAQILGENSLPILAEAAETDAPAARWKPRPGEPARLADMVGQERALYQIKLNVDWAIENHQPAKPMLFSGPSGLGKTMVGGLVAGELGIPWIRISMADSGTAEVKATLALAAGGGVLFLDELHAATDRVGNALLVHLDAAELPFTPIAATTDPAALKPDLLRRFTHAVEFTPYRLEEAEQIAARKAAANGLELEQSLCALIARAGRCNPAKISVLVEECAMLASRLRADPSIDDFREHLHRRGSDDRGIDDLDRRLLYALSEQLGGVAGIQKIAAAAQLTPPHALERLHGLGQEGLVRVAGTAGWAITSAGRRYLLPKPD